MRRCKGIMLTGVLIIGGCMIIGCQNEMKTDAKKEEKMEQTEEVATQETNDGFRVGKTVSEAYVDPSAYPTLAPEEMKASGYEYDRDALAYELVWSDEFDYEGLPDDEKWDYDVGGSGWGNHELQYYTKGENVTVKDGYLTIEARKENYENMDYTSTRLVTRKKGDWTYAKIEVSAKLPTGVGTWPAIWMLPTDWSYGNWPASGEIDIMEHVGYDQDVIHGSTHCLSYYHSIGTQKTATVRVDRVSEEFHVYSMEWLPDRIEVAVDGEVYFTYIPTQYKSSPSYKEWPFDKQMHLLINFAVGGDWGGSQGLDESIYPQQMVVDYVRVYQSPEIMELTGQSVLDQEGEANE